MRRDVEGRQVAVEVKGFGAVKLVHHESRQLKQRYSFATYNQMDKLSIRLINSNSRPAKRPLRLSLKTWIDLARAGKLRTGLRGSNGAPTILPTSCRHDRGRAVVQDLEYSAVPCKVSVPGSSGGVHVMRFSFGRNQQTQGTIVHAINPAFVTRTGLMPTRDSLLTTTGNVSLLASSEVVKTISCDCK